MKRIINDSDWRRQFRAFVIEKDEDVFLWPRMDENSDVVGVWKAKREVALALADGDAEVELYAADNYGHPVSDIKVRAADIWVQGSFGIGERDFSVWVNPYADSVLTTEAVKEISLENAALSFAKNY